ncbi:MAG: nucleotidyltransferase domain-containing protein [Gammaproteobacteria bacterium]|nr:nucleotidyltransferase domain-containing protein [Gammaproteobacteria bacterium]
MAVDATVRPALDVFQEILTARYGHSVKAVYLFGSRARGDHRPDSDADVAVFIDSEHRTRADLLKEQFALSGEAYDIWLDTGIRIQPWVFASEALAHPERDQNAHLLNTILTEGAAA